MENSSQLIHGRAALIVIDIQKSTFIDDSEERSIPNMPNYRGRMEAGIPLVTACHDKNIPVIFIQEIHRADGIDFGRELDGCETVHCLDDDPRTDVALAEMGGLASDYIVPKRRYSAFFGTDLDILLRGIKAETLILIGGLTDVCVHYTFVDGHQSDYRVRVVKDCVAGSSIEAHDASLRAMEYLQTGAVQPVEAMLAAIKA